MLEKFPFISFFRYWNNLINLNYSFYQSLLPVNISNHFIVTALPVVQHYVWLQPELPLKTTIDVRAHIEKQLQSMQPMQFVQLLSGEKQSLIYPLPKNNNETHITIMIFSAHKNKKPITLQIKMNHQIKILQLRTMNQSLTPILNSYQIAAQYLCHHQHEKNACQLFDDLRVPMHSVDLVLPAHTEQLQVTRLGDGHRNIYISAQIQVNRPREMNEEEALWTKKILGSTLQFKIAQNIFLHSNPVQLPKQKKMTLRDQANWQFLNSILKLQHYLSLERKIFISENTENGNILFDKKNKDFSINYTNEPVSRLYRALHKNNVKEKIIAFQNISDALEKSGNQQLLISMMKETLFNTHEKRLIHYLLNYLLKYYSLQDKRAIQLQLTAFVITIDPSPENINQLAALLAKNGDFSDSLILEWILPSHLRDQSLFSVDCWRNNWLKIFHQLSDQSQEAIHHAHYWLNATWGVTSATAFKQLYTPLNARYTYAVSNILQPVTYLFKGPAHLRFTIRALVKNQHTRVKPHQIIFTDGEKISKITVFNDGVSSIYQHQFYNNRHIGTSEIFRENINAGWHRLTVSSRSMSFLISVEKEVPVTHRLQTISQQITSLTVDIMHPTLDDRRLFIANKNGFEQFYNKLSNRSTAIETVTHKDSPLPSPIETTITKTLFISNTSGAYLKMMKLLYIAENNIDKRLNAVNQAEKIFLKYPTESKIYEIRKYLAGYENWRLINHADSPAGIYQQVQNHWRPDIPNARLLATLTRIMPDHFLLAHGIEYRANIENRDSTLLHLQIYPVQLYNKLLFPMTIQIQIDQNPKQQLQINANDQKINLPIQLKPGRHTIAVWLNQPISAQYINIHLSIKNNAHTILNQKMIKTYYIATQKQPVTVFINHPGIFLVFEKNNSGEFIKYRWVNSGESKIIVKPIHGNKSYVSIYEQLLSPEATYGVTHLVRPISFDDYYLEKKNTFHITAPINKRIFLPSDLHLGTYDFIGKYRQRFSETNAEIPIDRFGEFGLGYYRHIPISDLYYNLSGALRTPEVGDSVWNLNANVFKRIIPTLNTPPFTWWINSSAYTQHSPSNGQLYSFNLNTGLQQIRQIIDKFYHAPFIDVFDRLQTQQNVPSKDASAIDQDVYANYYRNLAYGADIGDLFYYQPQWDNIFSTRISLGTHENFNPFLPNIISTRIAWSQFIGSFVNSFIYDNRYYFSTENRTNNAVRQRLYWNISGYHTLGAYEWINVSINAGIDPNNGEKIIGIELNLFSNNHQSNFDDIASNDIIFKNIIQNITLGHQTQGIGYAGG